MIKLDGSFLQMENQAYQKMQLIILKNQQKIINKIGY